VAGLYVVVGGGALGGGGTGVGGGRGEKEGSLLGTDKVLASARLKGRITGLPATFSRMVGVQARWPCMMEGELCRAYAFLVVHAYRRP